MTKILITTSSFGVQSEEPLNLLKAANIEYTLNPHGRKLTKEETKILLANVDGVIAGTELYDEEVLAALPQLKALSRCGAGTDGIDIPYLNKNGINLFNTPEVHITAVAELTLAGLLSLSRNTPQMDAMVKANNWKKIMGTNISGKTVGLVGYGKVAKAFANLLTGFNVKFKIYDPFLKEKSNSTHDFVSLDQLLKLSDIISLHIPYSKENAGLIGGDELNQMKSDVLLLNTARGGIIDEKALFQFLKNNPNAGAYLDVFEKEPYEGQLKTLNNFICTAHVGTFTKETRVAMETQAAQNIINHFNNV